MGQPLEGEDAPIVDERAMRVEVHMHAFVALVGFDRLGDGSDSHLRAEPIFATERAIDEGLQSDLVGAPTFIGDIGDMLAGAIECLHRLQQRPMLLGRGLKLQ